MNRDRWTRDLAEKLEEELLRQRNDQTPSVTRNPLGAAHGILLGAAFGSLFWMVGIVLWRMR